MKLKLTTWKDIELLAMINQTDILTQVEAGLRLNALLRAFPNKKHIYDKYMEFLFHKMVKF